MKSIVSCVCLVVAAVSQPLFAADEFSDYRLGHYTKAADPLLSKAGKDPVADYYLGRLYLYGYGQQKNDTLAMRYFKQSAEKGYLPAALLMAKYALLKDKNPEEAVRWFKQAATSGDVDAQLFMAAAYRYGFGVKPNTDLATKYIIDAAKNGNAIAQFALAEHFLDSRQESNKKLGLIWLNKAAVNGNLYAITKQGTLYLSSGKLVTQDIPRGMTLLNQAAAQNFVPAMVALGEASLNQNQYQAAVEWFNKAINQKEMSAYLHLARANLNEKSPIFDAKAGFLWMLKAAQENVAGSKKELANLYLKGIGTAPNKELADQWVKQAEQDAKVKKPTDLWAQTALWLSNGATNKMDQTAYQMKGILVAWQNPNALKETSSNQAPIMDSITSHDLFKPQFELVQPNDVPIASYAEAMIDKSIDKETKHSVFPFYALNPSIEAIQMENNWVMNKLNLPVPYSNASYYYMTDKYAEMDLMDRWVPNWEQEVNYMAVFNPLYLRALLGDAQSQFQIGQMFEYGLGVEKNYQAAIIFYQNAAEQQHLGAEYNLGMMYLQHPQDEKSDVMALNYLTDSAFKGNRNAQYVLAKVLEQGKMAENGKQYIKPDPEQALSMLYLAAANGYGRAQYELAERLARESNNALNKEEKMQRISLIRELYQKAADTGVMEALLPLAFYNAMDNDKQKAEYAFAVAKEQADLGDEKAALLLGLLYDRGIGTSVDAAKAIYWYQHAGVNPVSQFILGTYMAQGKGISEDKEQARMLLSQSEAAQFSYADFNLAVLNQLSGHAFLEQLQAAYTLGNSHAGIVLADYYLAKQDDAEKMNQAKQIYTTLAEKGDAVAQLKLGFIFDQGLGVTPNSAEALRWYTASATQGNAKAQYLLGQMYQLGKFGVPDYQLAKEWYQKAAGTLPEALVALGFIEETVYDNYADALKAYEQAALKGNVQGMYDLGLMFYYGKGIAVDNTRAQSLMTEAANKGLPQAMDKSKLSKIN